MNAPVRRSNAASELCATVLPSARTDTRLPPEVYANSLKQFGIDIDPQLLVRRAQVEGELAAERRVAERAARQRQERTERIARLERSVLADRELLPQAERLAAALAAAVEGVRLHVTAVEALLQADREAGEGVAAELRARAAAEADVQNRLRQRGETVTAAEVRAAQAREHDQEARRELEVLAGRLGLPAQPSDEPLDPEQAAGLRVRIDRLLRRIPIIRTVWDLAQRITSLLDSRKDDAARAMDPVWCTFGGNSEHGGATVLALLSSPDPVMVNGRACLAVLVPTAPVPVGGGLLFVPREWVHPARLGAELATATATAPKAIWGRESWSNFICGQAAGDTLKQLYCATQKVRTYIHMTALRQLTDHVLPWRCGA